MRMETKLKKPTTKSVKRKRSVDLPDRARIRHKQLSFFETLKWWILFLFIVIPVRIFFSVMVPPLIDYVWHNGSFLHLAQDDEPVYAKVRLVGLNVKYGPHRRETFDVFIPDPTRQNLGRNGEHWTDWVKAIVVTLFDVVTCYPRAILAKLFPKAFGFDNSRLSQAARHPAIVFVHGGGFAAVDPGIQHHQSTSFARKGFSVYCPAYPWAPENPHPHQLLSGLRMLKWLRENHHHDSVSLVGESAGGTLVTMLAVLLANPKAMNRFSYLVKDVYKLTREDVSIWEYPTILSVTSWYGILDQESWKQKGFLSWGLEWTVDAHRQWSPWPFSSPESASRVAHECDFLTLTEACQKGWVEQYPPLHIVAGSTDPLGLLHSSRIALKTIKQTLKHLNQVQYGEYEAGHAFIGLNPFILVFLHGNKWRTELALPATIRSIDFITKHLR